MNDIHRIEDFLKLMASAAKDGVDIYTDRVYKNLIYLGVGNKKVDISSNFPLWVDRFLKVPNINVYVNPNWNYFCQFKSSSDLMISGYGAVKLYIPVDKEHVFEGANQLFDFLVRENIPHISKIGRQVRFDDIVVRVDTPENANKVIEFVNNNLYLKEGSLSTNPFAVSGGNVSMTWDGNLSYNEVVSSWISEYINWEKSNNNLDNVSYSRFYAFVEKKCDLLFENGQGLQQLIEKLTIDGIFVDEYDTSIDVQLLNYHDVTRLILISLHPKTKKEDFYMYINRILDDTYQRQNIDRISNLRECDIALGKEIVYTEQQKSANVSCF